MPLVFACSVSHTPGIRAWADAPPADQKERFFAGYDDLRERLWAAQPDTILVISSEHFANFFLDCMPAFAIGQAERYFGPIEPWVKIAQGYTRGDANLSEAVLKACYAEGLELNYASELQLDHGIMIPLSFLDPGRDLPVVPLIINCMTYPMPTQERCYELGRILAKALQSQERRVAVVAAGGLSHAPGERIHGSIDSEFDRAFLRQLEAGDVEAFTAYSDDMLEKRGLGTHEIRTWVALAGVANGGQANTIFYEPVVEWATGCALLYYE